VRGDRHGAGLMYRVTCGGRPLACPDSLDEAEATARDIAERRECPDLDSVEILRLVARIAPRDDRLVLSPVERYRRVEAALLDVALLMSAPGAATGISATLDCLGQIRAYARGVLGAP
jgi:hypothetical protein